MTVLAYPLVIVGRTVVLAVFVAACAVAVYQGLKKWIG